MVGQFALDHLQAVCFKRNVSDRGGGGDGGGGRGGGGGGDGGLRGQRQRQGKAWAG